jgi:hypothetical protein
MDRAQKHLDAKPDDREALRSFANAKEVYQKKEELAGKAVKRLTTAENDLEVKKEAISQERVRRLKAASGGPSADEIEEINKKAREQAEREAQAKAQQARMIAEQTAREAAQFRQVREENARAFESGMDDFK